MMRWVRDLASVLPVAVAASAVLAAGEGAGHALFERRGITKEEAPGDDADSIKAAASASTGPGTKPTAWLLEGGVEVGVGESGTATW